MSDNDYEVGYGKPPVASRFKSGKSGNPKGRPTGSKNFSTLVNATFDEKVTTKSGGRSQSMTKKRTALTQLANKAAAGDLKAVKMMLDLAARADATDSGAQGTSRITPEERRAHYAGVIAAMRERLQWDGGEGG